MSAVRVRRLSGAGRGAIAVLGIAGSGALERVAGLTGGAPLAPGSLRLVNLRSGGELLDRALAVVLAPDEVELHLHGSPALVEEVLEALGGETPRSEPDSIEALARRLLPEAPCEDGARILLDQAEGALRSELLGLLELPPAAADDALDVLIERGRVAGFALRATRVLLRGPVNAGKSTLFNALVAEERVLVADEPGTTRDVVRERARLEGWPLELWDTPGELEADAPARRGRDLEAAGLALARELERSADWILWLAPPEAPQSEPMGGAAPCSVFASRADERTDAPRHPLAAGVDPAGAVRAVAARFRERFALPASAWHPGRGTPFVARQLELLRAARAAQGTAREAVLRELLGAGATTR